jgi:hypothetical protein
MKPEQKARDQIDLLKPLDGHLVLIELLMEIQKRKGK